MPITRVVVLVRIKVGVFLAADTADKGNTANVLLGLTSCLVATEGAESQLECTDAQRSANWKLLFGLSRLGSVQGLAIYCTRTNLEYYGKGSAAVEESLGLPTIQIAVME